jgi:GDP-L-fucose synthase
MIIVLTGSTGFIGRNLKEYLKQNHQYKLLTPTHNELDLQNSVSVKHYLKKVQPNVVIHTANCNDIIHRYSQYEIIDGNLRMFFNLERCRMFYGKLLYYGSGAEYDRNMMKPVVIEGEFDKSIPTHPYDFSKYIMRKSAMNTDNIYDLCLFGVFGKYEEYRRRFISNNICKSLLGHPMTLRQNARFDYLFIDDLCKIMDYFICNTPRHKVYNICSGRSVELLELAHMINEITGLNRKILVDKEGYQSDYTASNERLLGELGYIQLTEYKDAIKQLIDYYGENTEKWCLDI